MGPVFVRAMVTPALADPEVDLLFSVAVPATRSAAELEQDLFLLWPGAVGTTGPAGELDPALVRFVEQRGLEVVDGGRLELLAVNLYQVTAEGPVGRAETRVPGGAPFVTFVQAGGALGLSPPATWIRLPWTPELVNRTWLMDLRFTARGLLKPKPATWLERTFWGPRYRLVLSFHDVRHRAVFPLYFWHRDRVVHLGEDASQLIANFAGADTLKVDELFPPTARRQLSESLDNTEVISLFLDAGEGLNPQVLSVQFGYFSGVQSWAPVLIPALFFLLGNMASPVIRLLTERWLRRLAGRVHFGRMGRERPREHGVVVTRDVLARLVPGETTYEEVLRLCGPRPEEHEQLARPEAKTLVYRGRRAVPRRRRTLGWLATVDGWDVEDHEVEIVLERGVVADVRARIRRTHPSHPERA